MHFYRQRTQRLFLKPVGALWSPPPPSIDHLHHWGFDSPQLLYFNFEPLVFPDLLMLLLPDDDEGNGIATSITTVFFCSLSTITMFDWLAVFFFPTYCQWLFAPFVPMCSCDGMDTCPECPPMPITQWLLEIWAPVNPATRKRRCG